MHDFVYSLMAHFGKLTNHGILQCSVPIGRKTRNWREVKCSPYTHRELFRWPFSRPRTSFRCKTMLPVPRETAAGRTSGHNIRHGPLKPLGRFFLAKPVFALLTDCGIYAHLEKIVPFFVYEEMSNGYNDTASSILNLFAYPSFTFSGANPSNALY